MIKFITTDSQQNAVDSREGLKQLRTEEKNEEDKDLNRKIQC